MNKRMLVLGASTLAIGIAAPGLAQVVPGPLDGILVDAVTIDDTLVLTDLDDTTETILDAGSSGVEDTDGGNASAVVSSQATGWVQQSANATAGDLDLSLVNEGDYEVYAIATADAPGSNVAQIQNGFAQFGSATGDATQSIENTGSMAVTASIDAVGTVGEAANGSAGIYFGVYQETNADGDATGTLSNAGDIALSTSATATGSTGYAMSGVFAGVVQLAESSTEVLDALSGNASVDLTNAEDATISIDGMATATATAAAGGASALNYTYYGVVQAVGSEDGEASATITNDGSIAISSTATATATNEAGDAGSASAGAYIGIEGGAGIAQFAEGDFADIASVSLVNNGSVDMTASASALADSYASANASVFGVEQSASGSSALVSLSNSGTMAFAADAMAEGDAAGASAGVIGVGQYAEAGEGAASVSFYNGGDFSADAVATAMGGLDNSEVGAYAYATGVDQEADGIDPSFTFANDGSFTVSASAAASFMTSETAVVTTTTSGGTSVVTTTGTAPGYANAEALGYSLDAGGNNGMIDVSNTGDFTVTADVDGNGDAYALGMEIDGGFGSTVEGFQTAGVLSGEIVNDGSLTVSATALGGDLTVYTTGTGTAETVVSTTANNAATATGILIEAAVADVTLTNTGSIEVSATTDMGESSAYGIVVTDAG
ncbi:hypothetical protein, partial [Croceicoccus sp. BE223]|uniref:beta strand repeat-containing protein n=1 Tax=Croceicoccus sp. BE223 TaxID=2817716 RepID=UPI00285D2849